MRSTWSDRRSGGRRLLPRAGALALAAAVTMAGCGSDSSNRWVAVYGTLARPTPGMSIVRPAGRARAADRTFSALTRSTESYTDVDLQVTLRTLRQLRLPRPNPWEVAWVLWDFADSHHFYYVALKPNGWEIGKEDPAYPGAQRFLASGSTPRFPVGRSYVVRVTQNGPRLAVSVGGRSLISFLDRQRPYLSGRVGLYSEDAVALYRDLHLSGH